MTEPIADPDKFVTVGKFLEPVERPDGEGDARIGGD